jgi:hypothetical protein
MRALRALPIAAVLIFALPGVASADVLWDQFDTAANEYEAVIFPPPYNAGNQEVADDFLVNAPAGQRWSISEVDVHGNNGAGQPNFVHVAFYANNGTLPADTPIIEQSQITPSVGLDTGNFNVPLNPPVELEPGTYWVSVQAIEGGGDWRWTARSTQNLHEAALREAGAHGYTCPAWVSLNNCFHTTVAEPDLSFRLIGLVVGGGSPTPPMPPKDTTPPVLIASAPKTESIKRGFVTVTDKTNEMATDTATGTVNVPGAAKGYRLRPATSKHPAGASTLKLKIPKKAFKAIRRALAHHRKATARVQLVSRDAAGNSAKPRKLRIRLKR